MNIFGRMLSRFRKIDKPPELPKEIEEHDLEIIFTDAYAVRQAVENLIADDKADFSIRMIAIYGDAAVGKTTALKMSRLLCRKKGIPQQL